MPFLRREAEQQRRLDAPSPVVSQAANVQRRRLEEQRRLEHARHEAAHQRPSKNSAASNARATRPPTDRPRRRPRSKHSRSRLAKAEAAHRLSSSGDSVPTSSKRPRSTRAGTVEPTPTSRTDAGADATPSAPALDRQAAPNILAARGGAPGTTCKEKDDAVAAVMAVLDD